MLISSRSETTETIAKSLEELVEGCDEMDFPQVRHDFSDTKIYWRKKPRDREALTTKYVSL
jgi:hypothetical protein